MKRTQKGYTLLELMIVVMLIGIITAAAAPQIAQGMSNNAVSNARNEGLMIFRAARREWVFDGTDHAYAVTIDKTLQLVRLDRGVGPDCASIPVCNNTGPTYGGPNCAYKNFILHLTEPQWVRHAVRLSAINVGAGSFDTVTACFTPRGTMEQLSGGTTSPFSQNLTISFDRLDGVGNPAGVLRRVIINDIGVPRVLL